MARVKLLTASDARDRARRCLDLFGKGLVDLSFHVTSWLAFWPSQALLSNLGSCRAVQKRIMHARCNRIDRRILAAVEFASDQRRSDWPPLVIIPRLENSLFASRNYYCREHVRSSCFY